jgi:TolB-like protein/lipopolysaccharide biosynthesis regulator YciM
MSEEPFGLPDWIFVLAVILLSIGFLIAIILSWIYDINPERGVVKTEPAHKVKDEDIPKSSNSWKIASYISFVVIIGLIVLNVVPRSGKKEILEKSIAVMLFDNDSPSSENAPYMSGYRTAIHNNLCQIKELRILSLSSTERYKDQTKTIPEIAKELGVGYLLTAHGLILNKRIRLTVQLVDANNNIVWSNPYEREIELVEDHIDLQSEVSQLVAGQLQATITPEEKERIEKYPTTNLTAYDFYQRGRAEYDIQSVEFDRSRFEIGKRNALEIAEDLFHKALEYDSAFALAYTGLAWVYYDKYYWETYIDKNFLDSMLILANIALSFDDQLAEAYIVKGYYYAHNNMVEQAVNELDKAIRFNPNNWRAYEGKGECYLIKNDFGKAIINYNKAASLHRGPLLPEIYKRLADSFALAGFKERSNYFAKEALALDGDSTSYYYLAALSESFYGNFEQSIELGKKINAIDSMSLGEYLFMGNNHNFIGQFEEAITYYQKAYERHQSLDEPEHMLTPIMLRLGQAYLLIGLEEEGTYYLEGARVFINELDRLGRLFMGESETIHGIAGFYACMGENDKAFERLRLLNQKQHIPVWLVVQLKVDPFFDSIRDEPEFQQIVRDVEAKYQAEHERVRQWLEENEML